MKQTLTNFFIATSIFMLGCTSCKKDTTPEADNTYGLPNASQTGANILACRINGKNWVSNQGIYALGGGVVADTLAVTGSTGDLNYFENIIINIRGNLQQGLQYQLNNSGVNTILFATNKSCLGNLGSNILNAYSINGNLKLSKLDRANKIVSGTFTCNIPIPNCDTLKITDGRFDIKYH